MNTTGKLINIPMDAVSNSGILELDQRFFPHPWTEGQWLELNSEHHVLLVWNAGPHSENLAFALLGIVPGDDTAHLYKILVHPELRGTGLVQTFWAEVVAFLREHGLSRVYLEVESSNSAAVRFYQKSGFRLLRKIPRYYSNGEDALIMDCVL